MPTIHFVREGKRIDVPEGSNLRDIARAEGINIYPGPASLLNCRGNGLCGTCLVQIDDAEALSAPNLREIIKLGAQEAPRHRLACQSKVEKDVRCLTLPEPPQGWQAHSAYQFAAPKDPFEDLPPLGAELQAEQQEEALGEMEIPPAIAGPEATKAAPAAPEPPAEAAPAAAAEPEAAGQAEAAPAKEERALTPAQTDDLWPTE